MVKVSLSGNTIYLRLLVMKGLTRIELFYFDDNFRRIAQWVLRGEPTESIDGNYHRNKTGRMASNPFIESHCMCKVFLLGNDFLIKNGHFRLKQKRNRRESSKSIENKCTH